MSHMRNIRHLPVRLIVNGTISRNSMEIFCAYPFLWLGFNYIAHWHPGKWVYSTINFTKCWILPTVNEIEFHKVWVPTTKYILTNRSRESLLNWFAVFQINHNIHFTWTSNWKSLQFYPFHVGNWSIRNFDSCLRNTLFKERLLRDRFTLRGKSHHFSLFAWKEAWWIGNVFSGGFVWWNQNLASFNLFHCGHVIIINAKAVNWNIIIAKIKIFSIVCTIP